jgi:hypothetical protein
LFGLPQSGARHSLANAASVRAADGAKTLSRARNTLKQHNISEGNVKVWVWVDSHTSRIRATIINPKRPGSTTRAPRIADDQTVALQPQAELRVTPSEDCLRRVRVGL